MSTSKRKTLETKLIHQIRHLIAGGVLFNQQIADRVGLHLTDLQCLNLLDLWGPVTPGKLAAYTRLTTGGVTVMLDRLETSGYIRREPSPTDRRSVIVHVNQRKLEKVNALYEGMTQGVENLFAAAPESELEAASNLFDRMAAMNVADVAPSKPTRRAAALRKNP
jgi:DNA-binding MarR family transcriptional regulator